MPIFKRVLYFVTICSVLSFINRFIRVWAAHVIDFKMSWRIKGFISRFTAYVCTVQHYSGSSHFYNCTSNPYNSYLVGSPTPLFPILCHIFNELRIKSSILYDLFVFLSISSNFFCNRFKRVCCP